VLGDGDRLEHGLAEIGQGGGYLGLDLALGYGGEKPSHGGAEITSGKQIREKEGRYVLAGLFCGQGFGFLLAVEVAEMRVAGAARSAALAAIGKGESTQVGGTVFLRCGRRATNGAVRGHGSLQN